MSNVDGIVDANRLYAESRRILPGSARPGRRLAVVSCMDARMDLFATLGLQTGDAHVIRNAGGIVTEDVIRSLCLSQRLLGTREIVLVHHTDCGLEGVSDGEFAARLRDEVGEAPAWSAGGFSDVFEDVRMSMRLIAASRFLPHRDAVHGFVYDVATGLLAPVA